VQLHENLALFEGMDIRLAAASKEEVEETKILHDAFKDHFSGQGIEVIPFLADPELELIKYMDMKHGGEAYRGYGILDEKGRFVYSKVDDYWGENFAETVKDIKEQLEMIE
jgi:alkyl hydroperoxide reductase subunit AhpC